MNALTDGKGGPPLRPGQPLRLDLKSKEHGKIRDWILERLTYSANAKKEIEREAGLAFQCLCSWVDEAKHPWPAITFDPVLFAAEQSRLAKFSDALFSQAPLFGWIPGPGADPHKAERLTTVSEYHVRAVRPRQEFLTGFLGQSLAGIQIWHPYWDYEERIKWIWRTVPKKEVVWDPVTLQPAQRWVSDGAWKHVRVRSIHRDSPNIRALDITQVFPDDTQPSIAKGEWIIIRDEISGREARQRIREDRWDKAAVERAIDGQAPPEAIESIQSLQKWLEDIGLKPSGGTKLNQSQDKEGDKDLRTIEVLECWRRWGQGIQRIVLLNRAWIAWYGPNPYGHGEFPFVESKNYTIGNRFWGLSDYRVSRYLIRGIQSLANSSLTESVIAAMPLIFKPLGITLFGMRWEPRAVVEHDGPSDFVPQWFKSDGLARNIAQSERSMLKGQFDQAFGSNDPGRGSIGDSASAPATTAKIANEMAGLRDKLLIDTFVDHMMLPVEGQWGSNLQQFQDAKVESSLVNNPNGEPISIWPEDFRCGQYFGIETPSVSSLKELDKRRKQELYETLTKAQDPSVNRRELTELYLGAVAPNERDKIMLPMDQNAANGMPPMMGPNGPITPQNVGVMNTGEQADMQSAAAELANVYGGGMQ